MRAFAARLLALGRAYAGGLMAAAMVTLLAVLGGLEPLEAWSLNQLFALRGPRMPQAPIVIVSIDEPSFVELNQQWPFPRALHGELLRKLAGARPIAIGVDLVFDAPSSRGEADDRALGDAIAQAGNVVLGSAPQVQRQHVGSRSIIREIANYPIAQVRRGAAAVAPLNLAPDSDGTVRRIPVRLLLGTRPALGLSARLHQLATAAGLRAAPLPSLNAVLINFRGPPRTYPWVSYYRVVRGEVAADLFRDKIVLIGPTSAVFHDVFATPFARGSEMPGVEIHANALETLLRGDYVREAPSGLRLALVVAAALLGAALVVRLSAVRAVVALAVVWTALTLAGVAAFVVGHVWIRGMASAAALVLGYGATVLDNFVREQREKRRLSQFFSPEVLRAVVRQRGEHGLGSSRRLVTVLFSDIRGFTSIAEQLQPEQVAEMLRDYLSEMTEVVFTYKGTVDKYIGDCVMALYNVPFGDAEHALNAIRTALDLQERTLEVSARWQATHGVSIRNGVGINTGEAVVGTMGSRQRLEYTAIGDTVNLASRLESLTKEYQTSIIISESTYRYVRDQVLTRELADVTVKGKSQPVKIYAVMPHDIRKHPRVALGAGARLARMGGGVAHVRTRDISEGGLAVAGVPDDWGVGTPLVIRCEGDWLPHSLAVAGTIVWRRGEEAGIVFHALDPASVPALAERAAHVP